MGQIWTTYVATLIVSTVLVVNGDYVFGLCMAQTRLYDKEPYRCPPQWNIGKGSTYAGDSSLRYEGAITDQFSSFLALVCSRLDSRFDKDNPFHTTLAVSYIHAVSKSNVCSIYINLPPK